MEDDVTNLPADNEVAPVEEVIEEELELETEEEVEEEEHVEVEREGKKYRIPKALESELLMQSDYTKKTQTLAEQRKAVEAQESLIKQRAEQQEVFAEDLGKLYAVKSQLQAYYKVDWNALEAKDSAAANRHWREFQLLKDHADGLEKDLTRRAQERQFEEQQNTAKQIEQGRAKLAERIPGWKPEKAPELLDYGVKAFGFSGDELGRITDPRAVEVLYWAKIGKESYEKQRTQQKAPQQTAAPVTQLASKRPAPTNDLSRKELVNNTEAWVKARNQQIAKKRAR